MALVKRKNEIVEIVDKSGSLTKKSQKNKAEAALELAKKQAKPVIFLKQGQNGEFLKSLRK